MVEPNGEAEAPVRVLIVDDNSDDRELAARALAREMPELEVEQIGSPEELARALAVRVPDLVVTDYELRWTDGLQVLRAVKERCPECGVVMYTGTGNEEVAVEGMKAGLDDYIAKSPLHLVRLAASARAAVRRVRQRRALDAATAGMDALSAERAAILRGVADGVIVADRNGRITFVNEAAERLHGTAALDVGVDDYTRVYHLMTPDGDLYPPQDFPLARAVLRGETVQDAEWRIERPDGSEILAQGSASPVRTGDGTPIGAVLILRDVTRRRRGEAMERLLSEAGRILASSFQTLHTVQRVCEQVAATVADCCVVDLATETGELERIAGAQRGPGGAEPFPLVAPPVGSPVREVLREGAPRVVRLPPEGKAAGWNSEIAARLRSLGVRTLLLAPLPSRGGPLGVLTVAGSAPRRSLDAADLRLATELALRVAGAVENARLYHAEREARAAAEEANQAKSDFLAVMSHELRTPLNVILGYADLLDAGVSASLGEPQRRYVERIAASGRHLLQLIDEVLSFSRLEAGAEQIRWETVDPGAMAEEVLALAEPLARTKGIAFRAVLDPKPGSVRTDPGKVRQILLNLLSNAVKFTEQGAVELRVRRESGALLWEVRDSGIGIPPEHLDQIWEPFWQVDQRATRRSGGTGLGLSVSRRLAALLGGELRATSTPGEGSTFALRIPADPAGGE